MNERVVRNPNFKDNAEFYGALQAKGIGAKGWPNTNTEVENLGDGKFTASITVGHRVFFDKTDGNKPKKHKLTDERPNYVLIQSAKCCVEVYPYYAKYFDIQHEEVRLYEERWVVQMWRDPPAQWQDIGGWNPQIAVEEYSESAGDVVKVTVTYDTDYGPLNVEYFQRDGNALKHNVSFQNTSGSTETFRVLQCWAGIVGDKCNSEGFPVDIDEPFLAFHTSDKTQKNFMIAENLYSMIFSPDRIENLVVPLTEKCLQRPVKIEGHAQGMKADFIYGNWDLAQHKSLIIDPDTTTLNNPTEDGYVTRSAYNGTYTRNNTAATLTIYKGADDGFGECARSYAEWPIGALFGETVTKVEFRYHGSAHGDQDHMWIYAMANQPSDQSDNNPGNSTIWDDAGDGTAYLNDNATFVEVGTGKDVGGASGPAWDTSPKTDLQTAIDGEQSWFAIGIRGYEIGVCAEHAIYSEDKTDAADPNPTLHVEYGEEAVVGHQPWGGKGGPQMGRMRRRTGFGTRLNLG